MSTYLIMFNDEWVGPQTQEQLIEASKNGNALLDEMKAKGVFVFADGALDASTAVCSVTADGDQISVTDGPFAETKEHLGGFTVITCDTDDEARQWTSRMAVALQWPQELHRFPHS